MSTPPQAISRPSVIIVSPTGPQFLEVRSARGVELINVSKINRVMEWSSNNILVLCTDQGTIEVHTNLASYKDAIDFLRQTPSRGSVVLREEWTGKRRTPEEDLEDAIPDEEATKV